MKFFDKLFKRQDDKPSRYGPRVVRSYAGAKIDRLSASWTTVPKPINADIRAGLRILRARSREQAQNNDHVRQFLRMIRTNVVGHQGIIMQSRVPERTGQGVDTWAAAAIESAWEAWGKKGSPDVTNLLSWKDIQRLFIETVATDGEAILRLHRSYSRNASRFAVEFIDAELLDVELNRELKNGNRIVMGVELDSYGAPAAYHFRQMSRLGQDYYNFAGRDYVRVPAADIVHFFLIERVGQVRGVPWCASALQRLNMLNGYEEAELVASRVAAAKMGFFEQEADGTAAYSGEGVDDLGNIVTDAEAGSFEVLPAGMKFNAWDPQHPNSAFASFVKATLRGISAGLGVGYNSLANDLEGVNYSSLRQGAIDERGTWMALQDVLIESLHERVFNAWLAKALMVGIQLASGGSLRTSDIERYKVVNWQPRRWQWVDPKKEMDGHETAMRCLVRSPQRVIMEQGDDPDEVLADWLAWFKKLDAMGIPRELALAVFTGGAGGGLPDPMAEQAAIEN